MTAEPATDVTAATGDGSTGDGPSGDSAPTSSSRRAGPAKGGPGPFVVAALVAVVLAAAITAVALWGGGDGDELRVEIPLGTGATLDRGERVDVLERVVTLEPGQRFVLENRDSRPHVVGPVTAGPGETVEHTFAEGVFTEVSTVHLQRTVTFVVE